jgi:hypothetical protein
MLVTTATCRISIPASVWIPAATHIPNRFLNDGRQIFVKVSYLFRF